MKNIKKPLISIILIAALLSSIYVGVGRSLTNGISPNGAKADYITFEGVAGNDYYSTNQYSYNVNQWSYENYVPTTNIIDDGTDFTPLTFSLTQAKA